MGPLMVDPSFPPLRSWGGPGRAMRAVASVLLVTLGSGCDGVAGHRVLRAELTSQAAPAVKVEVVTPERAIVRRTIEQPGQIEPFEVAPLHAKLAGYVREVAVDIGDRVQKGQALARLDVPEVEADLARQQALLIQAEADHAQTEALVRVAQAHRITAATKKAESQAGIRRADADVARWEAELSRVTQLVRESALTAGLLDETRSKQAAALAARDEVRARLNSADAEVAEADAGVEKARADVAAAAARVAVARVDVRKAEALAAYTRIEAPFDGVVTRRGVDTGHLTHVGADGPPLFVVARDDRVRVKVGVPEVAAAFVDKGDGARVRVQAIGDRSFEGKVERTSWALDAASRTLMTEVDLITRDTPLRPGLYAYVSIVAEEHPDALTLPSSALVKDGAKTFCVVVREGKASRRELSVGIVDGARVEVLKGLDGAERVVKASAGSLTEGQTLQIAEPAKLGQSGAKP